MAEIIELLTELRMDSSEFTRKVSEAKAQIADFSKESSSSFSSLGFGIGTVATTAVIGLGYEVGKTADKLNDLYETSKKLGTSAGDLQTLESAFKSFGVSGDQVVRMMGFIQKSIGDAELGIGQTGDTFKLLGLDVKELASEDKVNQVLHLSQAIAKLKDNTQQMAVARAVAGRGGADLLGAARGDLAGAINEYKGLAVDDKVAENAHKFVEQLNYAEAVMESLSFKFVGHLKGWFDSLQGYIRQTLDMITSDPKTNAIDSLQKSKLDQLHAVSQQIDGSMKGNYNFPGAGPGLQQLRGSADLDASLGNSHIPNFMDGSSVEQLKKASTPNQKVKSQIDDLGDSAEKASKKIKDLSDTGSMIASDQKSAIQNELKRILGDDVKPQKISRDSNSQFGLDMQEWDANVKTLFENIKQYGDTKSNERQLSTLKMQANSIGDTTGVGVINDLQKYAKEQKPPKTEVHVSVSWDKGLKGNVTLSGDNQAFITDGVKSVLAQEASGMGK